MKSIFKIHNIYTFFLIASWLPYVIIPSSTPLAILNYYVTLIIGLYYAIKVLSGRRTNFINALFLFLSVMSVYGFFRFFYDVSSGEMGLVPASFFIKKIVYGALPIIVYYYFSKNNMISRQWMALILVVLVILCIGRYYDNYARLLEEAITGKTEFTNNIGYEFVYLLPFFVIYHKKMIFKILLFLIVSFFLISAMKRGAILCFTCGLVYYIYFALKSNSLTKGGKVLFVLGLAIVSFAIYYFIQDLYESSIYFEERVTQTLNGDSSTRDETYSFLLDLLLNESSIISLFIGYGADGSIMMTGNYAHQDWLELAINCGFLGVGCYIYYWISFWRDVKQLPKNNVIHAMLMICFITMFLRSMFSMGYSDIMLGAAISCGYCLGQIPIIKSVKLKSNVQK